MTEFCAQKPDNLRHRKGHRLNIDSTKCTVEQLIMYDTLSLYFQCFFRLDSTFGAVTPL